MLKFSEQIDQISTALAKAQGTIENATKNVKNDFFKSKYADLAEVINEVRKPLADNGLALSQHPSFTDGMVYVTSLLSHTSGQWIQSCVSAPTVKADPQGVGSAISYCRRYAMSAILLVAQEDDDSEKAMGRNNAQKNAPIAQKPEAPPVELDKAILASLTGAKDLKALSAAWSAIPVGVRHDYAAEKDAIKAKLSEVK